MIRGSHKFQDVYGGIGVGGKRVPQVGIEVGQARAINNEVEILL